MRSCAKHLILCLIASSLLAVPAFSVVYVDQNAPGPEHDGLSWDTAFLTIQEGVDAATPSGEVWVADGVYVENVTMGEGVQLYGGFLGAEPGGYEDSLDQRDFVNNVTIIDGNQSGSCVVMAVSARVDGFTITNGSGTLWDDGYSLGGGVYSPDGVESAVVANNAITGNSATHGGGILIWVNSSAALSQNEIVGNEAYYGGGIYCQSSSASVTSNTVAGDHAVCDGGGMACVLSALELTGNTIAGNVVSWEYGSGGGIWCYWCASLAVTQNTIVGNSCGFDGGGIHCTTNCHPILTGNTVRGNSAGARGGGGSTRRPLLNDHEHQPYLRQRRLCGGRDLVHRQ